VKVFVLFLIPFAACVGMTPLPSTSSSSSAQRASGADMSGQITMPDVFKLPRDQATAALRRAGVEGEIHEEASLCGTIVNGRIVETGEVCEQQPAAGRQQGARLSVTVRFQTEDPRHGNAGKPTEWRLIAKQELIKRDDACGNLAKEERNPQIEQARTKLSEGKRGVEAIYTALDRQLTDMASNLDGLAGDSDDSDVTNAERKLDEVDKLIDQLDRVKGNDGEARRRVELYRNLTRAGRVAMQQLHTLKQSKFRVDKAPDKCRDAEATVDAAIKEFVPRRDPRGVSEIPLRAQHRGTTQGVACQIGRASRSARARAVRSASFRSVRGSLALGRREIEGVGERDLGVLEARTRCGSQGL